MAKQVNATASELETKATIFFEIDLQRMWNAVWKKAWAVARSAIAGVVAVVLITVYLITPLYQSSVMFYVNNNAFSVGDASLSHSTEDISASKMK